MFLALCVVAMVERISAADFTVDPWLVGAMIAEIGRHSRGTIGRRLQDTDESPIVLLAAQPQDESNLQSVGFWGRIDVERMVALTYI